MIGFYFDEGDTPGELVRFARFFGVGFPVWVRYDVVEPEGGADGWDNPCLIDLTAIGRVEDDPACFPGGWYDFETNAGDATAGLRTQVNEDLANRMNIVAMTRGDDVRFKGGVVEGDSFDEVHG